MKDFELKKDIKIIKLNPFDTYATIKYKNGKITKREFYYGDSFLSQSGRFFNIDSSMASVQVTDSKAQTRNIPIN